MDKQNGGLGGDSHLSACTRFRSENSCRPTKTFRVSRFSSSLHQDRQKDQEPQNSQSEKNVFTGSVLLSQEAADGGLVQPLFFVQKLGQGISSKLQEPVFHQILDPLDQKRRLRVKQGWIPFLA